MDYREHIRDAIEYLEANLCYDVDMSFAAQAAGYSKYHFLRIFREVTGLTPADYLRKRRLSEIARQICDGRESIANLAFRYGFNSKENFIRAFKREHHVLPSQCREAGNSLKLYGPFPLETEPFRVDPEIVTLEPFVLLAYHCDEDFPPNFWNRYNCGKWSQRLTGRADAVDYGVSSREAPGAALRYFIGVRREDAQGDRTGTVELSVPGGLYALFPTPPATHFSFVTTIHKTWGQIHARLEERGFRPTGGYELETYVESSRTYTEDIYIPIEPMDGEEKYDEERPCD